MEKKAKYSEMLLKEIQDFPEESLPQVIQILNSLKKYYFSVKKNDSEELSTGFCGIWKDERSVEDIINDIYSNRTGFGGRDIEL